MRTPLLYLLLGSVPAFLGFTVFFLAILSPAGMGAGEVALIAPGFAFAATVFLLGCGCIAIGRQDLRGSQPLWWS